MKRVELYMMIISAILILGFIAMIVVLYLFPSNKENSDLLYMAIGGLITLCTQVVGYYFGSSLGSKVKTEMLNDKNEGFG